jgi:uncharacterized protein YuzE
MYKPEFDFDPESESCYIKLSDNKIYNTKKIEYNLIIDLDEDGFIVGMKCLSIGLKLPYVKMKDEYGLSSEQETYMKNYLKW